MTTKSPSASKLSASTHSVSSSSKPPTFAIAQATATEETVKASSARESSKSEISESTPRVSKRSSMPDKNCLAGGGGLCVVITILVIITLCYTFRTIDSGYVGVVKRFGAVRPEPLEEGLNMVAPFINTLEKIDTRITHCEIRSQASSKDLQTVTAEVSIQYYLIGKMAPRLLQRIGKRDSVQLAVIEPAMSESVKAVISKYTAEELITKREIVKAQIKTQVKAFIDTTLKSKDLIGSVHLSNVAITDFEFSAEFNKAIEMKVRAEQQALQAKNEKIRRVTQAEAAAREKEIEAAAEAFRIIKSSEARAAAIKAEAESLKNNPELIRLRLAEKWNGVLPMFSGGAGGSNMLLDVSKIMNKQIDR